MLGSMYLLPRQLVLGAYLMTRTSILDIRLCHSLSWIWRHIYDMNQLVLGAYFNDEDVHLGHQLLPPVIVDLMAWWWASEQNQVSVPYTSKHYTNFHSTRHPPVFFADMWYTITSRHPWFVHILCYVHFAHSLNICSDTWSLQEGWSSTCRAVLQCGK